MSDRKNEIEKLLHAYKTAVYAKDVNAYMALYDEHVRIFDMWEKWSSEGAGEWRKSAEGWFDSLGAERVVVEASEIKIRVGDALATLDGFVKFTAQSAEGAEMRSLTSRLTWVLQSVNHQWKIVHQHTSAPVAFEGAKAIFNR
jgi:ketosteroid isomerase-like protein